MSNNLPVGECVRVRVAPRSVYAGPGYAPGGGICGALWPGAPCINETLCPALDSE